MGLLVRTDASDPHLDSDGSVTTTDDYQLTDTDAQRRSRQTSGSMSTADHEQTRDEAKQSKALDDKQSKALDDDDDDDDEAKQSKALYDDDDDDDDDDDELSTTYHILNDLPPGPTVPSYRPTCGFDNVLRETARLRSFLSNPPCSFTEEETKAYNKIVRETDGFGSIYVPPGVCHPGLLMPANMEVIDEEEEGSPFLDGLAELAVARYNHDNETAYQFVKTVRVNFRFDGWMFYNVTFQAREEDDKAGESPPRNFQARIRKFVNETRVDFCRFEQEPKPIQDPAGPCVAVE